ncbi:MAG TPA: response regulator [Aggregatilineales bacterium]|nr:response regulator [Anaerolineales bacterium]HRE49545.1 response regulator [Aggregatilineales bacterium]
MANLTKVLLVDDDLSTRHLFEAVLDYHDIQLMIAGSESEAMDCLTQTAPDVIVLDIVLPGKDGYKVLKALRANPQVQCPVVATTAYYTLDSVPQFVQKGFDGYLLKPIQPEQLVEYLQGIVGSNQ